MNLDNFTPESFFCFYVAFLRSLYLIHQNNHWKVKGNYFYSNHQLFQRLYEKAQSNADSAAEKMIGLFTDKSFNVAEQTNCINSILSNFTDEDEIANSLKAEKTFLRVSEKFYEFMKDNNKMTLGLDDLIMSIHNDSEEAVYLLQQSKED